LTHKTARIQQQQNPEGQQIIPTKSTTPRRFAEGLVLTATNTAADPDNNSSCSCP
jgi:hypothetical protein